MYILQELAVMYDPNCCCEYAYALLASFQEMKKQTKSAVFLDHYLSTLGLWRKPVARDGLSLFRAVSEQVCLTAFDS